MMEALRAELGQKSVRELRAEAKQLQIGFRNSNGFKKKAELIEEICNKSPVQAVAVDEHAEHESLSKSSAGHNQPLEGSMPDHELPVPDVHSMQQSYSQTRKGPCVLTVDDMRGMSMEKLRQAASERNVPCRKRGGKQYSKDDLMVALSKWRPLGSLIGIETSRESTRLLCGDSKLNSDISEENCGTKLVEATLPSTDAIVPDVRTVLQSSIRAQSEICVLTTEAMSTMSLDEIRTAAVKRGIPVRSKTGQRISREDLTAKVSKWRALKFNVATSSSATAASVVTLLQHDTIGLPPVGCDPTHCASGRQSDIHSKLNALLEMIVFSNTILSLQVRLALFAVCMPSTFDASSTRCLTKSSVEQKQKQPTEREANRKLKQPTEREAKPKLKQPTEREAERKLKRPTQREAERKLKKPTEREAEGKLKRPTERGAKRKLKQPTEREAKRKLKRPTEREAEQKLKRPTEREAEQKLKQSTKVEERSRLGKPIRSKAK
jgi:hypothetical protein